MIRVEKRANPSRLWAYLTPVVAVAATMIAGGLLFGALGTDPVAAIRTIFWDPLFGEFAFYYRGQLLVKAGPLILIAVGLALGFKAGIWNIGAEGQYIIGAICGAAVGLAPDLRRAVGADPRERHRGSCRSSPRRPSCRKRVSRETGARPPESRGGRVRTQ